MFSFCCDSLYLLQHAPSPPPSYVITNKKGQVLRRFHTMSEKKAEAMAATMRQLAVKAQNVARDLDPSVMVVYMSRGLAVPCESSHLLVPHPSAILLLLPPQFPSQNEMQYLRIKTKTHEVIAAVGTCMLLRSSKACPSAFSPHLFFNYPPPPNRQRVFGDGPAAMDAFQRLSQM